MVRANGDDDGGEDGGFGFPTGLGLPPGEEAKTVTLTYLPTYLPAYLSIYRHPYTSPRHTPLPQVPLLVNNPYPLDQSTLPRLTQPNPNPNSTTLTRTHTPYPQLGDLALLVNNAYSVDLWVVARRAVKLRGVRALYPSLT